MNYSFDPMKEWHVEEQTRQSLKRFIEKAQKLQSSRFAQFLLREELSLQMSRDGSEESAKIAYVRPDDEAIEAFVLTFRFFIQDGDKISFRYLANNIGNDPAISQLWKREMTIVEQWVSSYLSESSLIGAFGHIPTRQEIFDAFFYGDLVHMEERRKDAFGQTPRQRFEAWRQEEYLYPAYHIEFLLVLANILRAIIHIAKLSENELF